MKRLILLLLALYSINCDIFECFEEKDITKCSSHQVKDLSDFNCHPFHDTLNGKTNEACSIFPNSAEDQKVFWKIYSGFGKETLSAVVPNNLDLDESLDDYIIVPEKEYYGTNEIITAKYTAPSNEDMKIINSKNTCLYKFIEQSLLIDNDKYVNITDRNECFNTNQFPDFENLINCGFATLTFTTDEGYPFTLTTCYYIPDNHMPDSFQKLFKILFMDSQLGGLTASFEGPDSLKHEEFLQTFKTNFKNGFKRLEGDSDFKYELIVEDKYGKIYKYTDKSYSPEVIEEGMQGDKIYGTNNNDNQSKTIFINYILLLFMISLILI